MSLLREIQASILEPSSDVGPILLKLRFLASRLGSAELEEWVKHESEGYPAGVDIPAYRVIAINYIGTFFGPFGSSISNAPIAPYLIEKFAGEKWVRYEVRQSIASVDDLASGTGVVEIDASNLMLLLQGKVYEDYGCNSVRGRISKTALREIQNAVRTRILELTLELEKAVPAAADVTLTKPVGTETGAAEAVSQIFNQTIYGHYTAITNTGVGAQITLTIDRGDSKAMVSELVKAGIPREDATEFAEILASEKPQSNERPFGKRAGTWLARNIGKAADGTWKIGVAIATTVLEEAALRYYGLK